MSSKRPAILMGTLLLVLGAYFVQQHLEKGVVPVGSQSTPALPGRNSVSNLRVHQDPTGGWRADFDYFYTGEPRALLAYLELAPLQSIPIGPNPRQFGFSDHATVVRPPQRGAHHVSANLQYPGEAGTTQTLAVTLFDPIHRIAIATQQVDQVIDWPSYQDFMENQVLATSTPEQSLKRAQGMIDSEDESQIAKAKTILEKLLHQNSHFDPAYVELARAAMKSGDGSPESLHQAETMLSSALEIRPDSANARILLGYVYSHQHRFDKAEESFTQAAATNPPNAWLWFNWGEMLAMQHKTDLAIAKYREAIARPRTHDSYDRGRKMAYGELLSLLRQKKDLDALEVLYKQQVADYGPGSCYSTDYARFMLQIRGDTQGAIDLTRRALNQDCNDEPSREVLGLAEYVKWADTSGPERVDALNEARIYLPIGPKPLYLLASSDRTTPAAKKLIASGEPIDQQDSLGRTALLYAIDEGDLAAARRLLTLHARPDIPVGEDSVPLALIPVLRGNLAAIRLLRDFGVNYSKLHFRGMTAVEYARQSHNRELLDALGDSGTVL